ncbi:OmpA family protein [Roseateles albus]|uniref:OmpA family protein n=1 Tax=Roseateles albus TaxID=2987525 RepID=A0ABT5KFW5_9BURK|nr:OmpA family protein [Roseateles albus]MDC8772824.1 OmpA family protein [Roseateles albus]
MKMTQTCIAAALLASLASLAGGLNAQTLNPPEARITDARIAADLTLFDAQQQRLRQLNESGQLPLSGYSMAKAQCWLDVARHEYARNDRSAFTQEALTQSEQIARYLAQGGVPQAASDPALLTPLVNGAARLREDLWAALEGLKTAPGARCVQGLVACAEVDLVHAGNEENQLQWRHAAPYIGMAEGRLQRAQEGAAACAAVPATLTVAAPAAPRADSKPQRVASTQKWTLNGDALFKFGRADMAAVLPEGRQALAALLAAIGRDYERIDHIQVIGHTDHLGGAAYNDHLSWRRAETIRAQVLAQNLGAPVAAYGMGPRQPIKACPPSEAGSKRKELIACLQPNRRVEIAVVGIRQGALPSSPAPAAAPEKVN